MQLKRNFPEMCRGSLELFFYITNQKIKNKIFETEKTKRSNAKFLKPKKLNGNDTPGCSHTHDSGPTISGYLSAPVCFS
jgi:hypothetical protein